MSEPVLQLSGIVKRFPGVVALDKVDFGLRAGEIHSLMGENGAGKSSLIKVLTGVYRPDEGKITLGGQPIDPRSPAHASELGISAVYQEVNLASNLSVAENICLGREPRTRLGIDWREMANRSEIGLGRLGVKIDVRKPLYTYSIALQQLVAIARGLDVSAKVLVLDEPTSSLDASEVASLFVAMKRLRDAGMGIVFVSHFLQQVEEISDRITILRNGKLIGVHEAKDLTRKELVSLMIGREIGEATGVKREVAGTKPETVLTLSHGAHKGNVENLSFDVGVGEVVGFAGLLGSGRTETVRICFGFDSLTHGTGSFCGRPYPLNPKRAIRQGMGHCPEDRKANGIFPNLTLAENIAIVRQAKRGWFRPISRKDQKALAQDSIRDLKIATPDGQKKIGELSGGNQQKALLARWLISNPKLMLLDEPTRGIDVGAKFEIADLIEKLRKNGMAFVFVSSELSEVVQSSSKVVVLRDRKQVAEMPGGSSEDEVLAKIAEESA
ncbi:MAG: sugar ABC transporter ATP-binding protein [Chlorobia bacterium]|nr:sugar ABC transporter ATP-binding protein [Fimbriimonadaceae bacterium]